MADIGRPWTNPTTAGSPGPGAAGAHVLVINYMLCPRATIGEIVKQVRRGYRWIVDHSATLGLDPSRLTLVGHSAGAHLAAAILTDPQLPAPSAILGLSGIYDLTPLVQTSMNQELKLDEPLHAHSRHYSRIGRRKVVGCIFMTADWRVLAFMIKPIDWRKPGTQRLMASWRGCITSASLIPSKMKRACCFSAASG